MKRNRILYIVFILLLLVIILVAGYIYLTQFQGGATREAEVLPGEPVPTAVVPKIRILVANQAIPANTVLTAELVGQWFIAQERDRVPGMAEDVISSERQLVGQVTLVEIRPDEMLYATQFTPITLAHKVPTGERAVPLKVDQFSGVVGQLHTGDYVDIVFSGQIEMHYPQAFPPSPEEPPVFLSPVSLLAVKTILQDVQVLEVIPITVSASVDPTRVQPTPTPAEGGVPAAPVRPTEWILLLAVDDQEAEVLRFAQDQGMTYQLLLRAPDDHAEADTRGVTTKILVQTYEVPVPEQIRYEISPGELPTGVIP